MCRLADHPQVTLAVEQNQMSGRPRRKKQESLLLKLKNEEKEFCVLTCRLFLLTEQG
jgi:hypothetical protein